MGYFKNFIRFRCSCCGRLTNGDGYVFDDGAIFCFKCISEMFDQKGGTTMYINPFLAGILFTVAVEAIAAVLWALWKGGK